MVQLLKPTNLKEEQIAALGGIVGAENVSVAECDRVVHSRDMWPRTVMWTKRGYFPHPPDAIVSPQNAEEVSEIMKWASGEKVPIIAYGAGSGVCAGTLPIKGGIIISMKRMAEIYDIDAESLICEMGPGIYGEIIERRLEPLGYTMGHYPSSIYCSTLGGYLAARSAGQVSSRYGKIEDMVVGIEFLLPDGTIHRTLPTPTGSSRIDWNQILIGSEGTLGIITRAWMKIHPLFKHRTFQSYHFANVREGLDAMRQIMQAGIEPAALRLYDEFDSLVFKTHGDNTDEVEEEKDSLFKRAMSETVSQLKKHSLSKVLKRPGFINLAIDKMPGQCLLIVVTEGEKDLAEHDFWRVRSVCLKAKGKNAGEAPARYWLEHRHDVSYKQSKIFDSGSWVDTMEVATTWDEVGDLYLAVKKAVSSNVFIMAHFSHAYRDGCCIYFSFASASDTSEAMEDTYQKVWRDALKAVHENHGTITHHHGVGLSKGAMLSVEYGELWPLWRKVKKMIDPELLMNPGKLGEGV